MSSGGVYIVSLQQPSSPCTSRAAGLARGWGSVLLALGLLFLALGCLALALHTSTPGAPALWTGAICCLCGASGRAAATSWYSHTAVRIHLAALAVTLAALSSCAALTVAGLRDSSTSGCLLAVQQLLTCLVAGLVALLALGPALHLALGLAYRDPEFGARVARGELGARILVLLRGKMGPGGGQEGR